MKQFEFRLNRILNYRMRVEQNKKMELGKAKFALHNAERKVTNLKDLQLNNIDEMRATRFDTPYLRILFDDYLFGIRNQITIAKNDICEKTTVVDKKVDELVESNKSRKVIERLKEKRVEQYNRVRARFEQNFFDESARHKFLNKE